jgi:integrase
VLREYVLFLANTGIRHGTEAIGIKWSNIRYFTGLDKEEYLEVAVDGKVGKRQLVARDNTARYLERLRDLNDSIKHLTLKELLSKQLDINVFRTRSGYNTTTDALRGSFRQYLEHADILRDTNGVTRSLYCLRHTYATFRLVSGTDIHQLATQMGTSVKMLETFYSKVSPQMNAAIHSGRLETMWREEQED